MSGEFRLAARTALADGGLRANMQSATRTIRDKRSRAVSELPDWEELRDAGQAIKADVLARRCQPNLLVKIVVHVRVLNDHIE